MEPDELRRRVAAIQWHHRIDLGSGLVTPGLSQSPPLGEEALPPLAGRTVLDVGAWDGLYSFRAERQGAARVVALDHYVWGVDLAARNRYWEECRRAGTIPDPERDTTELWDPSLPGKAGFDLAREALESRVEPVVGDFMVADLERLGRFDVVFLLGVLYHLPEPLTALRRLRRLTAGVAVIETAAVQVPGYEHLSLLELYPGDELEGDYGNWFSFSEAALHGLCRAAGFARVATKVGAGPVRRRRGLRRRSGGGRIVVHAFVDGSS